MAISILNWNGWRDTLECLESVRRLDYPNYLTVVVDNGSWDDSAERIKAWAHENLGAGNVLADYTREIALQGGDPQTEEALESAPSPARLVLIRNEENLGFSGGHNVGIRYALRRSAAASYVFLLNNDAAVVPDTLNRLVEAGAASGAQVVAACTAEPGSPSALFPGHMPFLRQFFTPLVSFRVPPSDDGATIVRSDVVLGVAMLLGQPILQFLEKTTGEYLCSRVFLYGEETMLAYSASRGGFRSVFARNALIHHKGGVSGGGRQSTIRYYYPGRNMIFLANHTLPFLWRIAFHGYNFAFVCGQTVKNVGRGRRKFAWAAVTGMIDGYRGIGGKWQYHDREVRQAAS